MIRIARIITANDIRNDFIDTCDEVNENTPEINNEDVDNDDPIDSDDEYLDGLNDGAPLSNEDIENELDLFNTGILIKIMWF